LLVDLIFAALIEETENLCLVSVFVLHAGDHHADKMPDVVKLGLGLDDGKRGLWFIRYLCHVSLQRLSK
jgi:hypothetical protein